MFGRRASKLAIQLLIVLMFTVLLGTSMVSAARDRIPPTAPSLSASDVGANYVTLTWSPSLDNQPFIWYQVYVNGNPQIGLTANLSATIRGLTPDTTYTFTVRARDNGINWSPPSNPVTLRTHPANGGDTTAPTTPANLTGFDGGCGEAWLRWTESTDNVDPQFAIRYMVYVNGIFRPESTGYGMSRTVAYAEFEGLNIIEIFAVDSAGNRSVPASITMRLSPLCL